MPGQHSSDRPQGQYYPNSHEGDRAGDESEGRFRMSRRRLLIGAASAGAVGVVAAAGATAATRSHGEVTAATQDLAAVATSKGPIIIFMNDPDSGEMDIFSGTGRSHQKNPSLAATVKSMAPKS